MNKKTVIILIIVLLIFAIPIAVYIERRNAATTKIVIANENLCNTINFSVSSISSDIHVNSSINGTVFVYKIDENDYKAQIVANFEIDPKDWGGVEFYFPTGMVITKNDCSYHQEVPLQDKTHNSYYYYIDVLHSTDNESSLGIGRNGISKIPSGGGTGMVIIDLDIDKTKFMDHDIFFLVDVGCNDAWGTRIMDNGSDSVKVNIETESQ